MFARRLPAPEERQDRYLPGCCNCSFVQIAIADQALVRLLLTDYWLRWNPIHLLLPLPPDSDSEPDLQGLYTAESCNTG